MFYNDRTFFTISCENVGTPEIITSNVKVTSSKDELVFHTL